jgi:cysteine desulfurase/selenocysteine lyase
MSQEKKCKLVYAGKHNSPPTESDIIKCVNKNTKVVAFCNVSNLMGYELDICTIAKGVKKINPDTIVVCDATQSVPHAKIDVKKVNIDFLVCSAHKMCGGTGVGVAYLSNK